MADSRSARSSVDQPVYDANKIYANSRMEEAKDFKAQGTKFYKDCEYEKAIDNYQKILDILEGEEYIGHLTKKESERKDLLQAGRLNIALCLMKLKDWKKAKAMCSLVLEINPNVSKAWLRRGECSMNIGETDIGTYLSHHLNFRWLLNLVHFVKRCYVAGLKKWTKKEIKLPI